ncbi:MAG: DNA repair protein RecN, partial [Spirochaetae bacterium HGW-Spirochaetae-9]
IEGLRFDPDRLGEIESRLAELRRLKKKYGPGLTDVLARSERDAAAIEAFAAWNDEKAELETAIAELKKTAVGKAEILSSKRKVAASGFSRSVEEILSRLGMAQAKLPISLKALTSEAGKLILSSKGMDEVEFLIAPNPGEPPKPLAKIASGGELSRVALAIKAVLSTKDAVDTLIFDEIDTGIGGEVAADVGTYLKGISLYKQVLCVTHIASIAALASLHYRVDKKVVEGRTVTRIERMDGQEREEEIARMLAGDREGAASLAHAAELLRRSSMR